MARDRMLESRVRWLQHDFHCSWQVARGIDRERYLHNTHRLGGFALLRGILDPDGNATSILASHDIALHRVRHSIISFPDPEAKPSMFALLAQAGLLAQSRNEPVLGSDHLLLALLHSDSDAAEMLLKLGIHPDSVVNLMAEMERESQRLEWLSTVVRRPPDKVKELLGLPEMPSPPEDNRLGWALVRSLQVSNQTTVLQSELYAEIVGDQRSSVFWGDGLLKDRYDSRFLELACLVGADNSDLARRVLKQDPFKSESSKWMQPATQTLLGWYSGKDSLAWTQLSQPSNAHEALRAQGIVPLELGQSLNNASTEDGGMDRLTKARWVSRRLDTDSPPRTLGREIAVWRQRRRRVSTLHFLIAILVFEGHSAEAKLLRDAGVDPEKLCAFAQTVALEP